MIGRIALYLSYMLLLGCVMAVFFHDGLNAPQWLALTALGGLLAMLTTELVYRISSRERPIKYPDVEIESRTQPSTIEDQPNTPKPDADVQFTAYRPSSARPEKWYSILVFIHKGKSYLDSLGQLVNPNERVRSEAKAFLGPSMGSYGDVKADSAYSVHRDTEILFQPWIEGGGTIKPTIAAIDWQNPVHSFELRFRLPLGAEGTMVQGGVDIFVGPLQIGELHFTISVSSDAPLPAEPNVTARGVMYRKIFASYSHKDIDVVGSLIKHVETIGDRYLVDVRNLRSGEIWSDRLEEMIQEADVFQLFWSSNSMRSEFVRQEWEYALSLQREQFVRPVHWEVPLPEDQELRLPPESLKGIHFAKLPHPGPYHSPGYGTEGYGTSTYSSDEDHPMSPPQPRPIRTWMRFMPLGVALTIAGVCILAAVLIVLYAFLF